MDTIIEALRSLFTTAIAWAATTDFLSHVNSVFYWKPAKIEQSLMPVIWISPVNTVYEHKWTILDKKYHEVDITLIFHAKDYYNLTEWDDKKLYAVEAWIKMTEQMNADLWTKTKTICWIIQSNIKLPYTDSEGVQRNACNFCTVQNVRYDLRGDGNFPTYEVTVTVQAICIGDRS